VLRHIVFFDAPLVRLAVSGEGAILDARCSEKMLMSPVRSTRAASLFRLTPAPAAL